MNRIPLLVIAGPTATGKSGIAIKIAKKLGAEIISCDSAQVYKYMDIGTAKPTKSERQQVKHHLIDYVMPDEDYSAVIYKNDCDNAINKIISDNKIPLICGGTGMYLNAVLYQMNFGNADKSLQIRKELNDIYKKYGQQHLYSMLKEIDFDTAKSLHPNDVKRVIRAIEIYKISGKKSDLKQDYKNKLRYKNYTAILYTDRKKLYEKINKRTDLMIENGLVEEVNKLYKEGYGESKSLQAIGYSELLNYFSGEYSLPYAIEKIKQHTRNYAKRQLTWFKKMAAAVWYNVEKGEDNIAEEIINDYKKLL